MTKASMSLTLPIKRVRYHFCAHSGAVHGARSLSINSGINHGLRESTSRDARSSRRSEWDARERPDARRRAPSDRYQSYPDRESAFDDPLLAHGIPHTTAASTFIFGMRSVTAALNAKRRHLYKLYLHKPAVTKDLTGDHVSGLEVLAQRSRVPVHRTSHQGIKAVKHSMLRGAALYDTVDNGVCLEASALPQPPLDSLGRHSRGHGHFDIKLSPQSAEEAAINGSETRISYTDSAWRAPFLIWLDGVVDAGNVGAIMRSALYFGADGIILSTRATASITAGVLKTSAAAAEYLPLYSVSDALGFIKHSQAQGWHFYAAVAPDGPRSKFAKGRRSTPTLIDEIQPSPAITTPCVLVLGNEETGLSRVMKRRMDYQISIPAGSRLAKNADVDSLNVSVAAALLCRKFLCPPESEAEHEGGSETQLNEPPYKEAVALS